MKVVTVEECTILVPQTDVDEQVLPLIYVELIHHAKAISRADLRSAHVDVDSGTGQIVGVSASGKEWRGQIGVELDDAGRIIAVFPEVATD